MKMIKGEEMIANLKNTQVTKGFTYNEFEGEGLLWFWAVGWRFKSRISAYYIYADAKKDVVIKSILKAYPISLIYFNKLEDGNLECFDGSNEYSSIGLFIEGRFNCAQWQSDTFDSLPHDLRQKILETELLV